ncbi:unnamed protein product [Cuscuta campestris]|uniref:Sacsin/Nov domain-containing protein n=1 Tax=Cuscuta campestris TaxID=132261 RepID=A0A484NKW6_9ASTE|nr:unnamed protein product [Cuscuta campestris]
MATSPKEHIEEIRRSKFSIGGKPNPLTEDLHQAVKNLSAELYSKDVHFLMEVVQNAEDNEYEDGVEPSLEFVITSKDITETGAPSTLLIFNNEKGFSRKNIESICSVGRSTKKANRKSGGYIGEKGIGFKSVFLISARPYIFSNGYQIRFSEGPCPHCNVGYIVPEWVDKNQILARVKQIYGSSSRLPTTTIVLPLKSDKVKPVKDQLSSIHPELLLFLSKIRQLSVREDNEDPKLNTVSAISISSERDLVKKKNIDAESYLLILSADEEKVGRAAGQCSYHMWRQRFPVTQEHRVDRRMDVDEWVITLAFPYGERLSGGNSSPGIYAFLPTEMVTNFPFIIQADFLLSSSREAILLDNRWNQGILNCVPVAFLSAFTTLVKDNQDVPVKTLINMFGFLPICSSSYSSLNAIRGSIKEKLLQEDIIPCQSYTSQKIFRKPCQVGRLRPAFWSLLSKARKQGVSLHNISSHRIHILNSAFDHEECNHILNFLEVKHVEDEWYSRCIQSSDLVLGVSEDLYMELLLFVAENWTQSFSKTNMVKIPLLKYVDMNGHEALCSISDASKANPALLLSTESNQVSWLINWNKEFRCVEGHFFTEPTQEAFHSSSKWQGVLEWLLSEVKVDSVDVHDYAILARDSLNHERELVLAYAHFLYHSFLKLYVTAAQVTSHCSDMPIIDDYGQVVTGRREGLVVPANGSKWVQLIGSNPWKSEGYIELGGDYLHSRKYADVLTKKNELLEFFKAYACALDIPDLPPPESTLSSMSSPLTRENVFLLLCWIRNIRKNQISLPERFLTCIQHGRWLRVRLCDSHGYRAPSQSFFHSSSWGHHLQNGSVRIDIPLVDKDFYGDTIDNYQEELRTVGVMFEFKEACQFIGNHFMSMASSSCLKKSDVVSILNFIRYLRDKYFSPDDFINSIKDRCWLETTLGKRSPGNSVFLDNEWAAAIQISDIPFVDQNYYGQGIIAFKEELKLLGVSFGFNQNYQLVVSNLKPSEMLSSLSAEAALLALDCIHQLNLNSSDRLCSALMGNKCLKTVNNGYMSPAECFLPGPTWGCLLEVFDDFPLIDENFYGSRLLEFKKELYNLGVTFDFDMVIESFCQVFRQHTSKCALTKNTVLSLLQCCRKLKAEGINLLYYIRKYIREAKWLRTRLGVASKPEECILFGHGWEPIASVTLLPFIDDAYYGQDLHEYKTELNSMGVVTTFRKCSRFVPATLRLPQDPTRISPSATFSLLLCMKNFQKDLDEELIRALRERLDLKWIKTQAGYRCPKECLLFGPDWSGILKQEDGPFIDEKFYGPEIFSYRRELEGLGVVCEVEKGCSLIAGYLELHCNRTTINRIYSYLLSNGWFNNHEVAKTTNIWIPSGENSGKWATPQSCVCHDKTGLFGSQLFILDKYYSVDSLCFFAKLGVRNSPGMVDYFKLWKAWECAERRLSPSECCAFWEFVVKHWTSSAQKLLQENLSKIPVCSSSDGVLLLNKDDVFIADDLCLKELFEQSYDHPLFVWYPEPSRPSLPRTKLLNIYREVGVNALSETAHCRELSSVESTGLEKVNPETVYIGKNMSKLILGFLAQPSLEMEAKQRHDSLRRLVNASFLKMEEPIPVEYKLPLSSGKTLTAKTSRMMRWERESSQFFFTEVKESDGYRGMLEFATHFSEVVSEGILWEDEDEVQELAELIKLGYMVKFDEESINFLMKLNNLQIFMEDEHFISSLFPLRE